MDVTLTELEEAVEGATIEVKDNTGKVVAVKALNLAKGATEATFYFETALTADPEGIWTVEGIEIDFDLQSKLEAVYDAVNQVKLLAAL